MRSFPGKYPILVRILTIPLANMVLEHPRVNIIVQSHLSVGIRAPRAHTEARL